MENNNTNKIVKSSAATFEELYAKKDYKEAINSLLQNKQRFSSGTFHYNLGTTYAKLGDFGAARFHLEKAINLGMYNSATINNLNYVQSKLQGEDISTSSSLPDQIINKSLNIPFEAFVSMSLVLVLFFMLIIKLKSIKNKLVMVLFVLIALLPVIYSRVLTSEVTSAVAMKEIPLYEGPSKIFQEKGKIKAGSKIVLGEFKDGWFFVKFPISLSGWINKDNLGIF